MEIKNATHLLIGAYALRHAPEKEGRDSLITLLRETLEGEGEAPDLSERIAEIEGGESFQEQISRVERLAIEKLLGSHLEISEETLLSILEKSDQWGRDLPTLEREELLNELFVELKTISGDQETLEETLSKCASMPREERGAFIQGLSEITPRGEPPSKELTKAFSNLALEKRGKIQKLLGDAKERASSWSTEDQLLLLEILGEFEEPDVSEEICLLVHKDWFEDSSWSRLQTSEIKERLNSLYLILPRINSQRDKHEFVKTLSELTVETWIAVCRKLSDFFLDKVASNWHFLIGKLIACPNQSLEIFVERGGAFFNKTDNGFFIAEFLDAFLDIPYGDFDEYTELFASYIEKKPVFFGQVGFLKGLSQTLLMFPKEHWEKALRYSEEVLSDSISVRHFFELLLAFGFAGPKQDEVKMLIDHFKKKHLGAFTLACIILKLAPLQQSRERQNLMTRLLDSSPEEIRNELIGREILFQANILQEGSSQVEPKIVSVMAALALQLDHMPEDNQYLSRRSHRVRSLIYQDRKDWDIESIIRVGQAVGQAEQRPFLNNLFSRMNSVELRKYLWKASEIECYIREEQNSQFEQVDTSPRSLAIALFPQALDLLLATEDTLATINACEIASFFYPIGKDCPPEFLRSLLSMAPEKRKMLLDTLPVGINFCGDPFINLSNLAKEMLLAIVTNIDSQEEINSYWSLFAQFGEEKEIREIEGVLRECSYIDWELFKREGGEVFFQLFLIQEDMRRQVIEHLNFIEARHLVLPHYSSFLAARVFSYEKLCIFVDYAEELFSNMQQEIVARLIEDLTEIPEGELRGILEFAIALKSKVFFVGLSSFYLSVQELSKERQKEVLSLLLEIIDRAQILNVQECEEILSVLAEMPSGKSQTFLEEIDPLIEKVPGGLALAAAMKVVLDDPFKKDLFLAMPVNAWLAEVGMQEEVEPGMESFSRIKPRIFLSSALLKLPARVRRKTAADVTAWIHNHREQKLSMHNRVALLRLFGLLNSREEGIWLRHYLDQLDAPRLAALLLRLGPSFREISDQTRLIKIVTHLIFPQIGNETMELLYELPFEDMEVALHRAVTLSPSKNNFQESLLKSILRYPDEFARISHLRMKEVLNRWSDQDWIALVEMLLSKETEEEKVQLCHLFKGRPRSNHEGAMISLLPLFSHFLNKQKIVSRDPQSSRFITNLVSAEEQLTRTFVSTSKYHWESICEAIEPFLQRVHSTTTFCALVEILKEVPRREREGIAKYLQKVVWRKDPMLENEFEIFFDPIKVHDLQVVCRLLVRVPREKRDEVFEQLRVLTSGHIEEGSEIMSSLVKIPLELREEVVKAFAPFVEAFHSKELLATLIPIIADLPLEDREKALSKDPAEILGIKPILPEQSRESVDEKKFEMLGGEASTSDYNRLNYIEDREHQITKIMHTLGEFPKESRKTLIESFIRTLNRMDKELAGDSNFIDNFLQFISKVPEGTPEGRYKRWTLTRIMQLSDKTLLAILQFALDPSKSPFDNLNSGENFICVFAFLVSLIERAEQKENEELFISQENIQEFVEAISKLSSENRVKAARKLYSFYGATIGVIEAFISRIILVEQLFPLKDRQTLLEGLWDMEGEEMLSIISTQEYMEALYGDERLREDSIAHIDHKFLTIADAWEVSELSRIISTLPRTVRSLIPPETMDSWRFLRESACGFITKRQVNAHSSLKSQNPYEVHLCLSNFAGESFPRIEEPWVVEDFGEDSLGRVRVENTPDFWKAILEEEASLFYKEVPLDQNLDRLREHFSAFQAKYEKASLNEKKEIDEEIKAICGEEFEGFENEMELFFGNVYLNSLFEGQKDPENIAPKELAYLCKIIERISSERNKTFEGTTLTEREHALVSLLMMLQGCNTGQLDGILFNYQELSDAYKYAATLEVQAIERDRVAAKELISRILQETLEGLIKDEMFLRRITKTHPEQAVAQPPHQKELLRNVVFPKLGLRDKVVFDPYTGCLNSELVNLSPRQIFELFFQNLSPIAIVDHLEKALESMKDFSTVNQFLEGLASLTRVSIYDLGDFDLDKNKWVFKQAGLLQALEKLGVVAIKPATPT